MPTDIIRPNTRLALRSLGSKFKSLNTLLNDDDTSISGKNTENKFCIIIDESLNLDILYFTSTGNIEADLLFICFLPLVSFVVLSLLVSLSPTIIL